MSALPKSANTQVAKEAFMEQANFLIKTSRDITKETLRSGQLQDEIDNSQFVLENLIYLVEDQVYRETNDQTAFRAEMVDRLKTQIGALLVEQGHHSDAIDAFAFEGAGKRASEQNLQSRPGNSNPLMRTGR